MRLKTCHLLRLSIFQDFVVVSDYTDQLNRLPKYKLDNRVIANHCYDHLELIADNAALFNRLTDQLTNPIPPLFKAKILEWLATKVANRLTSNYNRYFTFDHGITYELATDYINYDHYITTDVFNSLAHTSARLSTHDSKLCIIDTQNISDSLAKQLKIIAYCLSLTGAVSIVGSTAKSIAPIFQIYPYTYDFDDVIKESVLDGMLSHSQIDQLPYSNITPIDLMVVVDDVIGSSAMKEVESVSGEIISSDDFISHGEPENYTIEAGFTFARNYLDHQKIKKEIGDHNTKSVLQIEMSKLSKYKPVNEIEQTIVNKLLDLNINNLSFELELEYDEDEIASAFTILFTDQDLVYTESTFEKLSKEFNYSLNAFNSSLDASKYLINLAIATSLFSEVEHITQ